ncbi:MAG: hypothetical protein JXR96_20220 [Deltaproteobacteria bacterium]|nr:hypothetical protein [Deltaproteobacteria bacterium]
MSESQDLLQSLSLDQKRRLLGALAELSWSDRVLMTVEKELFRDLSVWMGVDDSEGLQILKQAQDPARLRLDGLPRKVRAVVFVTGAMMVLVDGLFADAEKRDLAVLASSLGIAPDSAREVVQELRRRSNLREQIREAMSQCYSVAERPSQQAVTLRNVIGVLGAFFGVGVGAFTAPSIIPGVVAGVFAGALGGGILGRVVAGMQHHETDEYEFEDL